MTATARVTRGLAATLLAGAALAVGAPGATAADATEQGITVPTPTLLTATMEATPNGIGVDAVINLTFDAPIPNDSRIAYYDYQVWANGQFVTGTAFPHDADGEMSIPLTGEIGEAMTVSGSIPARTVTGRETFTVTTTVTPFTGVGGTSKHSNGLVPTFVD